MLEGLGRLLIYLGGGLLILGLLLVAIGKLPGLGRLPGDIVIQRENLTVYIPLGTMLLVSLVLTLVLNLLSRFRQ
ncbi:MAG: DUF2905 domain-containing protein [Anaerolineae bacterium]|nr:DUF2905 domain-containing protein [Anaerolineae bacterium]